ncbi:MAG TPA: beta-ketoacyl synthase N-terminal-like domain-containing protein, partial [Thermoanaerobaculia bacterium]
MRRVVVTGLGAVSALGGSVDEFRKALEEGRSGIAPIEGFDVGQLRFKTGAQVRGFAADEFFDRKSCELLDRFA